MKKSTIEKIEKEIDEKTKMPNDKKDNVKKEIITNIVIAGIAILYLVFIILGSRGTVKNIRTIDINIFSCIFLGTAIVLFEIAYRKDSGALAMHGIESLLVATFTLFLPYIIFELGALHRKYYIYSCVFIIIYYILKSIYLAIYAKVKYMNTISDVREIVKKEDVNINKQIKEEIEELELDDKIFANKSVKVEEKPKKRGRPRKSDTQQNKSKDIKKEIKKESNKNQKTSTTKKRGRPKKTETKTEAKTKTSVKNRNPENTDTPKRKRGRPRKVAESK